MLMTINQLVRVLPAALCFILVACSKINQENFAKIQPGMSMAQVVRILGEPDMVDSINFAGISGTSATWKTKSTLIVVQFLNDQVKIKTLNKVAASSDDAAPDNPPSDPE